MEEFITLLNRLQFGHQSIFILIDEIQQVQRSYGEAKPKLRDLQETLLEHLGQQTQNLYDKLLNKFSDDREKCKLVEFLIHDLKEIKVRTLIFFDEHPADMGDIRPKNFLKDFSVFADNILTRIKSEREYLFPLLEGKGVG